MACPRKFELARYEAGDPEASESERIREHLEGCQVCRCFVRGLERRRRKFLERHPVDQVVPELEAEVERRERSWLWRLRTWWWTRWRF